MNKQQTPVITVDGPSGSGKGTLCTLLAKKLGWHLLDSGALYRVLGYGVEKARLWDAGEAAWTELASELPVSFEVVDGKVNACYESENIERLIRTETGGERASKVAAVPAVRDALMARQQDFLQAPGLVADGRDMGTVVFPQAPLKVFLTASAEARAERRYLQLKEAGESVNLAALLEEIQQRDERDMNRAVAPLVPAHDAIQLDSTKMSIQAVFDTVMKELKARNLIQS